MINGISSMQLFDTKRKSVITENSYSKIKPLNMEFRVQVSLEDKKIHDKLIDMLASSSVELVNVLNKLFCHGGCIHFLQEEDFKYIGTAKNTEEYIRFDTFSLTQIACDKDDQIVDLYTMNPILIDGKIQYFKL